MLAPGSVAIASAPALSQSTNPQTTSPKITSILHIQDSLAPGDLTVNDGSFYVPHTFEGEVGQTVTMAQAYDASHQRRSSLTAQRSNNPSEQGNPPPNPLLERAATATRLANQGRQAYANGQYEAALEFLQQALALYQDPEVQQAYPADSRLAEATTLNTLGLVNLAIGNSSDAIAQYQQAAALYANLTDTQGSSDRLRQGQITALVGLGAGHRATSQFPAALDYYAQALALLDPPSARPSISQQQSEGIVLDNIGVVYSSMGQFPQALDYHLRAQAVFQQLNNRAAESIALNNIATVYSRMGRYPEALTAYEEALTIQRSLGNPEKQGVLLDNIGLLYFQLGQYEQSLDYRQQALAIFRQIGDRAEEAAALNNLGAIYDELGRYDQSQAMYQQALVIVQSIGDRSAQATLLGNIGLNHYSQGRYDLAQASLDQALAIAQSIGSLGNEKFALRGLGLLYQKTGRADEALELFQQALAIAVETGDRRDQATLLSFMGGVLNNQNQPELAITFYKQSVNITEDIRDELRVLSQEQQSSFTAAIADTYRELADLLLQQDRVLEAQQVLDLLKVQELDDYLHDVRGNDSTQKGLDYWQTEQTIIARHAQSLAQLQDYFRLQGIPPAERTPEQQQQFAALEANASERDSSFAQFLHAPDITTGIEQLRRTANGQNLNPDQLVSLQDNLRRLEQPTVLLYPLILDDRLELVLITPNGAPIRRTVPVSRTELNEAIAQFRIAVTSRTGNPQPAAQRLYQWLVQPIEADLAQAQATTILYAADGALRYVPLSALHDGNQWLVQRFIINHITAASLTDFSTRPPADRRSLHVLAAAFSDPDREYSFQVGDRSFSFSGLPYAGEEVNNIAATIPNTTELLNQSFSRAQLERQFDRYSVVHLATHAEFVSGQPEDSFILFGNGDRVTLRDIADWSLPDVDLVVLSACKTAVGGVIGDGEEILGFGYQVQRTGARAAIASLWYVSDEGSQALMTAFYAALAQGNISEAAALRQAQIALITGDFSSLGLEDKFPSDRISGLSRPYYWAPFILIGNGL